MIDVPQRTLEQVVSVEDGWNQDVVRRPLWEHYLGKCYLCERPISCAEFEIDHRIPRGECPAFVHCWLNLFPACSYCNGRRGRFPKSGGVLSPGLDRRVEARLRQRIERISSTEVRARFTAVDPNDVYAHNTAAELERIHSPDSGTTDTAKAGALELLDKIADHYSIEIHPLAKRARRARRRDQPDRRAEAELRRKLARSEPFAMLLRSMLSDELRDLIED
jgi:hypothetical protein